MSNDAASKVLPNSIQDFDTLRLPIDLQGITVRRSLPEEADLLAEMSAREIGPDTAKVEAIRRVMEFSTECIFSIVRSDNGTQNQATIGFIGYLLLNTAGLNSLLDNRFSGLDPNLAMLCAPLEPPAALYGWIAIARRVHSRAAPLIAHRLKGERYRHLDIYVRPATNAGATTALNLGFVPIHPGTDQLGKLLVYHRCTQQKVA